MAEAQIDFNATNATQKSSSSRAQVDFNATGGSQKSGSPRKVTGCSERLAGLSPRENPDLPPLVSPRRLTHEEQERHIYGMYNLALEKRKKALVANETLLRAREDSGTSMASIRMTPSEIQSSVCRLNDESIRTRDIRREERLTAHNNSCRHKNRTRTNSPRYLSGRSLDALTKEEFKSSVQRLYNESLKHEKETMDELTKEYCPPKKVAKLSDAELKQSVQRLYQKAK